LAVTDRHVLASAVSAGYRGLPFNAIANVLAALFVVAVMRDAIPHSVLAYWVGGVTLITITRLALWQRQRQIPITAANARHWAILLVLGAGIAGAMWGLSAIFFFVPENPYLQLFIFFVIGGITAGALASHSQYTPAYYAFALTSLPPAILFLLIRDDPLHGTMAVLIGIFLAAMLFLSQRVGQAYARTVHLQQTRDAATTQFRDFAEASADWFWEMDSELRFTYISGLEGNSDGLRPEDLLGRRAGEVEGCQMDPECAASMDRHLAQRLSFRSILYQRQATKGAVNFFQICGKPLLDAEGVFQGYRGAATEVTEIKLAEQALHEERERLRLTLDHVFDGIVTIDEAGIILSVNPAIERMFARKAKECIGKPFFETLVPTSYAQEDVPTYGPGGNDALSTRENIARRKDGSMFHVDLVMSKMMYRDEEIRIAVVRDISQQKALQAQLHGPTRRSA